MKDELEALLEDEEELEAELAQVLAHRTFYYYKKKENPAEQTVGQEDPVQELRLQEEREPLQRNGLRRDSEPLENMAGFPVPGDAEALYLGLVRAQQAAGYRRPEPAQRISLRKEEGGYRSAGVDAADLDRIFQRDARRYDGGFTWQ